MSAQDEVVLVETTDAEGSSAQIIYRNGGMVDARSLELLCDKVCCVLRHCLAACLVSFQAAAKSTVELQVGWPRRPPAKVEAALRNSYMTSTLTVRISQPGKPAEESMIGTLPTGPVCNDSRTSCQPERHRSCDPQARLST